MFKFLKRRQEERELLREMNQNLSRAVTLLEEIRDSVAPAQVEKTMDRLLEDVQKLHSENEEQVTPRQILDEWMLEEEERRQYGSK